MLKLMGKKIFTIVRLFFFVYLSLCPICQSADSKNHGHLDVSNCPASLLLNQVFVD